MRKKYNRAGIEASFAADFEVLKKDIERINKFYQSVFTHREFKKHF